MVLRTLPGGFPVFSGFSHDHAKPYRMSGYLTDTGYYVFENVVTDRCQQNCYVCIYNCL